ncbi:hypothetical protein DL96DRAFT_1610271 [Flagelloscypha sp. PMI_526]|nr:hypothetical protein DL96DRAFT_1610271 [Flagelloscypha sp. PMI_526]
MAHTVCQTSSPTPLSHALPTRLANFVDGSTLHLSPKLSNSASPVLDLLHWVSSLSLGNTAKPRPQLRSPSRVGKINPAGRMPLSTQDCRLPPELIFLIVELADRSQFTTLCLVCKEIRTHMFYHFFDPLLFTPTSFRSFVEHFDSERNGLADIGYPLQSLIFSSSEAALTSEELSFLRYGFYFSSSPFRRVAFQAPSNARCYLKAILDSFQPYELSWRHHSIISDPTTPLLALDFTSLTHLCISLPIVLEVLNDDETRLPSMFPRLRFVLVEDDRTSASLAATCSEGEVSTVNTHVTSFQTKSSVLPAVRQTLVVQQERIGDLLTSLLSLPRIERCGWGYLGGASRADVEQILAALDDEVDIAKVKLVDMTRRVDEGNGVAGATRSFERCHMKWLDAVWRDLEVE